MSVPVILSVHIVLSFHFKIGPTTTNYGTDDVCNIDCKLVSIVNYSRSGIFALVNVVINYHNYHHNLNRLKNVYFYN